MFVGKIVVSWALTKKLKKLNNFLLQFGSKELNNSQKRAEKMTAFVKISHAMQMELLHNALREWLQEREEFTEDKVNYAQLLKLYPKTPLSTMRDYITWVDESELADDFDNLSCIYAFLSSLLVNAVFEPEVFS